MSDPPGPLEFGQPPFGFGPCALFCGVTLRDQRTRVVCEDQVPFISGAPQFGVEPQTPPPQPPQVGRQ